MKKHTRQPQTYRKPRPKRVSMGELHYFVLTFRNLLYDESRQYLRDDINAHCPTLVQAMSVWVGETKTSEIQYRDLTFTWDVPLPQAFQEDLKTTEEVPHDE